MSDSEQQQPSGEISLTVKVLSGGTHTLRVPATLTVGELKAKLVDVADVPRDRQRLIFRGRALTDDAASLADAGIRDASAVHLVRRPEAQARAESAAANASASASAGAEPVAARVNVFAVPNTAAALPAFLASVARAVGAGAQAAPLQRAAASILDQRSTAELAEALQGALDSVAGAAQGPAEGSGGGGGDGESVAALADAPRVAEQLEQLAARVRAGSATVAQLAAAGALLTRTAADAEPSSSSSNSGGGGGGGGGSGGNGAGSSVPANESASSQRAPSGIAGASSGSAALPDGASLQDVLSSSFAQLGASASSGQLNLQSLSSSLGPLLTQLSTAAGPMLQSAMANPQVAASLQAVQSAVANGAAGMAGANAESNASAGAPAAAGAPSATAATSEPSSPSSSAAPMDEDGAGDGSSASDAECVETMRALLKSVLSTLGVSSLLRVSAGDWSPFQEAHGQLRNELLAQFDVASASEVTEDMIGDFARRCATALRVVALRVEDAPDDVVQRLTSPADAFAAMERETESHARTFAHLLLKDWTPSAAQRAPFGSATQRWSQMYTSAMVGAVGRYARNGSDDTLAVLRHVCTRALSSSMPAPTATMLSNVVMGHVARSHFNTTVQAAPVGSASASQSSQAASSSTPTATAPAAASAAAVPAKREAPVSTAGLDMFPEAWRETIARDEERQGVESQPSDHSEMYRTGKRPKRSFDARLRDAMQKAGVEDSQQIEAVVRGVPSKVRDAL